GIEVQGVVGAGTAAADIQQEQRLIQNETVRLTGPQAFLLLHAPVVNDPRNQVTLTHNGVATQLAVVVGRAPNAGEGQLDLATGRLTLNQPPVTGDRLVATYVCVGHQAVVINAPGAINPLSVTLADEATIGGAFPALPDTIRVFYAGDLATLNRGESAPEVDFAGAPDVATSFVSGLRETPYTTAHEVGHVLTDKTNASNGGHYVQPVAPAGNLLFTNQNLMRNSTSPAEGINRSKRLWDAADVDGVNEFTSIRGSHFTRAF